MLLSGIFLIIFLVFFEFRIMDFVPTSSGIRKQHLILLSGYNQVVSGLSVESVLTATLTSRLSSFSLTGPL